MKRFYGFFLLLCLLTPVLAHAQISLGKGTIVFFASEDEAKEILTMRDDFVQRMSPFDRAARLKTDAEVSEKEYLLFVGRNVLAWNESEKQKIASVFQGIQNRLEALSLPLPQKVFLIKTTGNEEGQAAYTRTNAIVFPQDDLVAPTAQLQKTISHELFHILSRANPDLRDKFYAAIGFMKSDEIEFPPTLRRRKITNPDAPRNDHYINLHVNGKAVLAVPILFSNSEKYDMSIGGEFFNYLQFQFLLVERNGKSPTAQLAYNSRKPILVEVRQVSGLFEQIGKNSGYIIHPEEILADNFAFMVSGERNLPSPEIVAKLGNVLKENRLAEPNPQETPDIPRAPELVR